jgi:uncharacterized membrane protein
VKQNQILLKNAMIAAVYAVMTIGLAPISYGPVQVRISECMTLLAFYDKRVIPGLVAGCFLANIGSPFGLPDMIIGTAATAVGLYLMRFCPNLLTASLMPVLANGVIIGAELTLLSALPPEISPLLAMIYVGLGEFAAVTVIGCIVMKLVMKNENVKAWIEGKS